MIITLLCKFTHGEHVVPVGRWARARQVTAAIDGGSTRGLWRLLWRPTDEGWLKSLVQQVETALLERK